MNHFTATLASITYSTGYSFPVLANEEIALREYPSFTFYFLPPRSYAPQQLFALWSIRRCDLVHVLILDWLGSCGKQSHHRTCGPRVLSPPRKT